MSSQWSSSADISQSHSALPSLAGGSGFPSQEFPLQNFPFLKRGFSLSPTCTPLDRDCNICWEQVMPQHSSWECSI